MKTTTKTNLTKTPARFHCLHAIAAAGLLLGEMGAATSRADILYVSLAHTHRVATFPAPGGGVGTFFTNSGSLFTPQGLAFDSANYLYVADSLHMSVQKFGAGGGVGLTYATVGAPTGLAFDSAGSLYVANSSTIMKFTAGVVGGGGIGSVFANTGLGGTQGLAFDSADNLYAANSGNGTIVRFTPGGVGSVFATGLVSPQGLAFDSAGNLYVADKITSTIERFTPGGVGSVYAFTGLSQPVGLAFDSAGELYAANSGNDTIVRFTPGVVGGGAIGTFFASAVAGDPMYLAFTDDAGVPLPLANQVVPEPASALLLLGPGAMLLLRRRRAAAL